jgi:hypothetical protein
MYENLQAQGRLNRISCSIEISFHQNKNPQKLYPPITTNENLSSDELSKLTKTIGCEDNTVEYKLKHLETSYDSAHSKLLFSLKTQSQHGVKQKSKLRQCYTAPGNTEL